MEALILGIYAGIVWLIFFKYKLLPWNAVAKVIVFTIPVVGMITLRVSVTVFILAVVLVKLWLYDDLREHN